MEKKEGRKIKKSNIYVYIYVYHRMRGITLRNRYTKRILHSVSGVLGLIGSTDLKRRTMSKALAFSENRDFVKYCSDAIRRTPGITVRKGDVKSITFRTIIPIQPPSTNQTFLFKLYLASFNS